MSPDTEQMGEQARALTEQGLEKAREIKRYDEQREGFAGEHWLVLGAGAFLLWSAGRRRSTLVRLAMTAAGSALVGRAAAGRGGVARVVKFLATRR